MHGQNVDISASLTEEPVSLLFLFRGIALQPTIINLIFAKIALFFMLWGIFKVFSRIEKPVAGFVVGILVTMHPLLSMNGGYFTVFIAISAVFWWILAFCNPQVLTRKTYISAAVTLLSGIFISPWFLLFIVILVALAGDKKKYSKNIHISAGVAVLLFCTFLILFASVPSFQQWSNSLLSKQGLFWLKSFVKVGPTLHYVYSWGALVPVLFMLITGVWFAPAVLLLMLLCISGILSIVGLDLGGILLLWILFSVLVAIAFDNLWNYLLSKNKVWVANILVIVLVICLFQIDQEGRQQQLVATRKDHKSNFIFTGGKTIFHPQASMENVLVVSSGEVDKNGAWLVFGNYHINLPGRYRATFYSCQQGSPNSYLDVSQAHGRAILNSRTIPELDTIASCEQSLLAVEMEYTVFDRLNSPVEHRLFYDSQGIVYFDHVAVEVIDSSLF